MAHETSKQTVRRGADRRYATRWLKGCGIDIGCGNDSLGKLAAFFPLMGTVRPWDLPDGDAMLMDGIADGSFDFVHSSHCLEHLVDPVVALGNWIRICRDGGHVIVTIPDEDLYEQGIWPSTFNADHKWTFTIAKSASWSPKSVNVLQLLGLFQDQVDILKIELLDAGFDYGQPRRDQSMEFLSESAIEVVLRKKTGRGLLTHSRPSDRIASLFAEAVSQHQAGRLDVAAGLYRELLSIDPDHIAGLNNLAMISAPPEAETLLRKALRLNATYLDAHLNLGGVLTAQGRAGEAEQMFRDTLVLQPGHAQASQQLASLLEAQGHFIDAASVLESAIAAGGGTADLYCRLGRLFQSAGLPDDAIRAFDGAIALDPEHAEAHIYRGHANLLKGDYPAGAEGLGWIWKKVGLDRQAHLFADEQGPRDLTGKRIVLSADSGLGDTLQFVRYAALLKEQGASVVVECQPALVRLLSAMDDVETVVPLGQLGGSFDLRVPFHNLLGAFGTTLETIPATVPYIAAPRRAVTAWKKKLKAEPGLKVGLVWGGDAKHHANGRRSIDPALLAPLTAIDGMRFVSLQKEAGAHGLDLLDWTDTFDDMADTAALVEALDLVISVDSAVAHLAGALGRPVWLLNRFDTCWRWLERRSDSPWYPTLRQFRQPRPGDWRSVIADVGFALANEFVAELPPARSARQGGRLHV